MRCPDCQKFVSLELQDPEDVSLDLESTLDGETLSLSVMMTARIARTCADCGSELKEGNLEASEEIEVDADSLPVKCVRKTTTANNPEKVEYDWRNDNHGEPEINEERVEQLEEGGGRYAKSFFGATVGYSVKCKCGEVLHEGEISDKVAASAMDELV